jgi:hypothetical protein
MQVMRQECAQGTLKEQMRCCDCTLDRKADEATDLVASDFGEFGYGDP